MKKSIKLLCLITLLSFPLQSIFSQQHNHSCSGINYDRSIELTDSSDTEEIKVEITDAVDELHLGINSTITSGYLTIEIYDPKGSKKGYFSVESQLGKGANKKEQVCGQMQKQIKDPIKGDWIVKLLPKNVTGKVSIHTMQHQAD